MKRQLCLFALAALSCTTQPAKPQHTTESNKLQKITLTPAASLTPPPQSIKNNVVCADGKTIQRASLELWKKEIEAAFEREDGTPRTIQQLSKIKALLQEVGIDFTDEQLAPSNPESGPYGSCAPIELGKITISDAKLTEKESHKLIEINFSRCNEVMLHNTDETVVVVLSVAGEGAFCEVGQISSQWIDQACLAPEAFDKQEQPLLVTPLQLLSDKHQDLQAIEEDGRCDFVEREGRFTTSFWTIRDNQLEKIFSIQSFFTEYRSPIPPTKWTETKIAPSGGFPKQLQIQEEVTCFPLDEGAPPQEEIECKASRNGSTWKFDGKVYAPNN